MNLSASDFYSHFRPSECDLRVFLRHHGEAERTPNPYEEVLRRLGVRHEKGHLATFSSVVDVSSGTLEDRERRTQEAMKERAPTIYQGVLKASASLNGMEHSIVGEPDFLVLSADGRYLIRDSKISKRINEKDHPEILRQMELYGWLYERTQGQRAVSLQVHSGPGDIVEVAYDGGTEAMEALGRILVIKEMSSEPYCPVGWTKCGSCGFYERCWSAAEGKKDIALIMGVDQSLSIALHDQGIETIEQLLAGFDEKRLAQLKRPWGKKMQRVGERASAILRAARCLVSGKEIILKTPNIPEHANYSMFDLEGLPPQLDELDKIYLWGMQVFGERPSPYFAATAGFGEDGERQGWESFLEKAKAIFEEYGDLPFVHWHHYERVWVDKYIERFGDRDGIAQRVRENLLNLLPIMQQSVIAPLPSYSLKVVEAYIGFRRTQEEYGGQWAMAKYIEAADRGAVIDRITELKRSALVKWPMDGVSIDSLTVDTPVPFSIQQLWFDLHTEMRATHREVGGQPQSTNTWALETDQNGAPVQRGDVARCIVPRFRPIKDEKGDPEKIRLSHSTLNIGRQVDALGSRLRDPRFDFLFRPGPYLPSPEGKIAEDLDTLLASWLGDDRPITILDLSGTPLAVQPELVGSLLRILYDALFWARNIPEGGRERPLLIVLEEAHAYLESNSRQSATTAVRRIAKEGRKYGIGMMLVSQRPSEIDDTILSQCGTIFALRLTNGTDRNHVTSAASENLEGLFAMLPVLRTGEAIILGEAVNLPVRTLIDRPGNKRRPDSSDPKVVVPVVKDEGYESPGGWNQVRDPSDYKEAIELWRSQQAKAKRIQTDAA